jgi:RNA polymerase sigma-70 factor (ECF subfamily)
MSGHSRISDAFVENAQFLKRFLARFFSNQQDIDDVAQETYLRAFAAEQKHRIEQPKAFLFKVAKNIALTELTRKSRQITEYIDDATEPLVMERHAPADEVAEAHENIGIYCESVSRLPAKCRQAFLLRKVHGLRHKEIAERMNLSISSIEKYLRQATLETADFIERRTNASSASNLATVTVRGDKFGKEKPQ